MGADPRDRVRVPACIVLVARRRSTSCCSSRRRPGTWRERMPSIFVDIVRLVLIVVGLGLLFSWVWGADVAGLFAALGVTSIVLGFALQNAVGSVISGLLLLFEQPFQLGDWLDTGRDEGPRRRGQLAGRAHRHRQRHPDHPQRHAGRGVVHQPQPAGRQPRRDGADDVRRRPIRPTSCAACSTGSPWTARRRHRAVGRRRR